MLTNFNILRDAHGFVSTGSETCDLFSNTNEFFLLSANTVATATVPNVDIGNKRSIVVKFSFTPGSSVYVLPNATPTLALPVSDTPAATLAELNPRFKEVELGQTLQFLTPDSDVYVSLSYYNTLG